MTTSATEDSLPYFDIRETMYPFYTDDSERQQPTTSSSSSSSFTPVLESYDDNADSDATMDCVIYSDDASDRVLRNRRNRTVESERRRLPSTLRNSRRLRRQHQKQQQEQQYNNGSSRQSRKTAYIGSDIMNIDKHKEKSVNMKKASESLSNANVFMESEDSLKSRRLAMLKLCQKNEKRIADFNNKITELQKNIKQAEIEIREIDHNLDQWVIEKRKRCRESVREAYLKKYEWAFLDEPCPVCFEPYKESILYDVCNHIMCSECNESLLSGHGERACPLCRTTIKGYTTFDENTLGGVHYDVISERSANNVESILRRIDEHIDLTTNEELV
ncbi:MAG: RING-HC finger protein [Janthinobacterium lividum]